MILEKMTKRGSKRYFYNKRENGLKGQNGSSAKNIFFSFTKKPFFAKPTIKEVMIFGVSEVPTVPVEEVKKFLKHIDKDMKALLFLTELEKVFFRTGTFSLVQGAGGPN